MKGFKKGIRAIVILQVMLLQMVCSVFATTVASETTGTITITLEDNGKNRANITFSIYKVADAWIEQEQVYFELTDTFEDADVSLYVKTAQEVEALMETLKAYIALHEIAPNHVLTTNEQGTCSISGLELGMYFIVPGEEQEYGIIASSLITLPYKDVNGLLCYEEQLIPKYSDIDIPTTETPSKPHDPSIDEPILGIEDMSPYIGTSLLAVGIILFAMALMLLLRRGSNYNE